MRKRLIHSGLLLVFFPCWSFLVMAAEPTGVASQIRSGASSALGFTLEDFFTSALDHSPRVRIAAEQMNVGASRKRAATGRLLPQLNATASVSDNRRTFVPTGAVQEELEKFDGSRYSVQLSQVLFSWREFSARNQASIVENQLEAQYYNELSQVLTDVADKYFDVLQAEDALDSIRSELTAVASQQDQVQSYFDRQLAQITDLYEVQARLAAVQAEQLMLQSELSIARESLRSVAGVTAGQLYRLDDAIEIPPLEESIEFWAQQSSANSHLIRASEYARQAANEQVSGSQGAYMPEVSIIVQRQDSNLGFDNAPMNQTDNTYVGVSVSIPLFAGGSNRAAVSEAVSLHSIAENELRQVQLDVNDRTRAAYLLVKSSEGQTRAARRLAESTALSAEAMQQGFNLGTVTSVDVLNSLRNQFQAERDLQQARYDHIRYLLMLKREAGTLTADDLIDVGTWLTAPQN